MSDEYFNPRWRKFPDKVNLFWEFTDSNRYLVTYDYYMTLEEVAKALGITRERVRQIEAKALRKLQHPTRSRTLKPFLFNCLNQLDLIFNLYDKTTKENSQPTIQSFAG